MGIPVLVIISTLVKIRTKSNIALEPFELYRKDGKIVNVELYNFTDINDVLILDIKQLKPQ